MQISTDKTVVLLLLGGRSVKQALQGRVLRVKTDRWLQIPTIAGAIKLPIRKEHTYLGTIIGYGKFERSAVSYRVQQARHTFNRLHGILISKALPLSTRVRLWLSCVGSVLLYSLPATMLDTNSASMLRTQVVKQLRRVARSPAHITHESNQSLLDRLGTPDVTEYLAELTRQRVGQAEKTLGHLHAAAVANHLNQLTSNHDLHAQQSAPTSTQLTEVTQIPKHPTSCPHCGIMFTSLHAVRTHIGKSHSDLSRAMTKTTYAERSFRHTAFMQYAKGGQPACKFCNKRFSSWRAFMGHFHQQACPLMFERSHPTGQLSGATDTLAEGALAPGSASAPEALPSTSLTDDIPLMQKPEIQLAAVQSPLKDLPKLIRDEINAGHCPACRYKCVSNRYLTRHAQQQHSTFRQAESLVRQWA